MKVPTATFKTALAAGVSMSGLMCGIDWAARNQHATPTESSPVAIAFLAVVFFASTLLYVLDVRNIAPEVWKTRTRFFYFPTDRPGVELISDVIARAFVWFFAASSVMAIYWWVVE